MITFDAVEIVRLFARSDCEITKQFAYDQVLANVGYRLPMQSSGTMPYEQKQAIIVRIRDEWTDSTKKRKIVEQEVKDATRCKAVDSLSGVYEYFDIDSYCKIDSHEYEARYLEYLVKEKLSRNLSKASLFELCDEDDTLKGKDIQNFPSFPNKSFDVLVAAATSLTAVLITPDDQSPGKSKKRSRCDVDDNREDVTCIHKFASSPDFTVMSDEMIRDMGSCNCTLMLA